MASSALKKTTVALAIVSILSSAQLAHAKDTDDRILFGSIFITVAAVTGCYVVSLLTFTGIAAYGWVSAKDSNKLVSAPRCAVKPAIIPTGFGTVYACPSANGTVAATFSDPYGDCPANGHFSPSYGGGGYGNKLCIESVVPGATYSLKSISNAINDEDAYLVREAKHRDVKQLAVGIVLASVFGCSALTMVAILGAIAGPTPFLYYWS